MLNGMSYTLSFMSLLYILQFLNNLEYQCQAFLLNLLFSVNLCFRCLTMESAYVNVNAPFQFQKHKINLSCIIIREGIIVLPRPTNYICNNKPM